MKQYIGTKQVNAKPMTRLAYNNFRGWKLPADENGADDGYLVEYPNSPNANTEEYAGYVSWSPKQQFEDAYRQCDCMTFGLALEVMKAGGKVARKGWNSKGMFLFLANTADLTTKANLSEYSELVGNLVLPSVVMKTADNKFVVGWLASQTDMLADDWIFVD